jgi:mRNA-degrading endonuclease RelE of RelBE toxin-antitoxin system
MAHEIEIADLAIEELRSIRTADRRRIVDQIHQQLEYQPAVPTRNRKCLVGAVPDFEYVPPLWELRVGKYRVFYDVDEVDEVVHVRAVRVKGKGQTTKDIIHEEDNS